MKVDTAMPGQQCAQTELLNFLKLVLDQEPGHAGTWGTWCWTWALATVKSFCSAARLTSRVAHPWQP
ncbi:hypothetical protein OEZ85_009257 [Tetradesmus obliquus]|uniref:Uncharacterized protein n=1 Tax=Tetradesmus obliquus TaxID=3088 RepID=A0ABY8U8Z1_TETOB|nr:hypothetical protein OEZ85_009257 [Tetradesmus obliquus]